MDFDDNGFIASFGSSGGGGGGGTLPTGIIGIPDGSGWYTFYASLNLALASAVSGDTIVFFDDFTESTTGSYFLDGVDINLNGHSYILDTADAQNTFTNNLGGVTANVYNGKIIRRNAVPTNVDDGVVIRFSEGNNTLNLYDVEVIQESDACICYGIRVPTINGGVFRGGSATLLYSGFCAWNIKNSTWYVTQQLTLNSGEGLNCTFYTNDNINLLDISLGFKLQDCRLLHEGNASSSFTALLIQSSAVGLSCSVYCNTAIGIKVAGTKLYNTSARSNTNTAISVSLGGYMSNCSCISGSSEGLAIDRSEVHNSYAETTSGSRGVFIGQDSTFFNSSVVSNNASGVGIFLNASINKISKCTIGMANNTGDAIDGTLGVSAQIVNCVADNSAGALVNTTNVTNIQTFTQDGFGNILIG